jgi:hypothetical protein
VLEATDWLSTALARRAGTKRPSAIAIATAATPCLGLAIYAVFLWRTTGHPLAWLMAQGAWGRKYQPLSTLISDQYTILANAGLSGYVSTPGYDVLNAAGTVFALATLWPVARRLGLAYALFGIVTIVPGLLAGSLMSAGRFSSVYFPAFIWLANAASPRQRTIWIAAFAMLQAFDSALFHTWRPMF